ncbi:MULTISPECIES: hypothetical protein [Myroides]|uniref:Uncharacterized protein n=2 Tax=Myroides odoratimimus TaxID=76832 RepID=A0ABN0E9L0_9FLAO|nr:MULTISPECIES: hypothetical protein [Myroides]AJA69668.1 hypothetical protein MYRA21_2556 [Myroides sp. A21]EHO08730.1 hypothetical protein HMPREF9712_02392 [Myroides odoratimimus CCUG 10230]EHO10508.1 hypothetical protein HMPREF9714_01472 [Myroides odoratimimus CCUG 12901]EHO12364.1 hypothetical protein HMPREF9715_01519 [Myroides odoratimimus CIP 101113]EKB06888.1 hypothetical protein HMPREF9711_00198 [Myroides odoratimimus CCUG 3837]
MKKLKKTKLIEEIKKGEKSGFSSDFNRDTFKEDLHQKYATKE